MAPPPSNPMALINNEMMLGYLQEVSDSGRSRDALLHDMQQMQRRLQVDAQLTYASIVELVNRVAAHGAYLAILDTDMSYANTRLESVAQL